MSEMTTETNESTPKYRHQRRITREDAEIKKRKASFVPPEDQYFIDGKKLKRKTKGPSGASYTYLVGHMYEKRVKRMITKLKKEGKL